MTRLLCIFVNPDTIKIFSFIVLLFASSFILNNTFSTDASNSVIVELFNEAIPNENENNEVEEIVDDVIKGSTITEYIYAEDKSTVKYMYEKLPSKHDFIDVPPPEVS